MGFATIKCRAQLGVRAPRVVAEVYLGGGLPGCSIVGLADTAVRESRDRVKGAIESSGLPYPQQRIIVNLAPADMRKSGNRFDLSIALGILAASGAISQDSVTAYEVYGELALNGELRPVTGILPSALRAAETGTPVIVPAGNAEEALIAEADTRVARSLLEVVAHLRQQQPLPRATGSATVLPAPVCPDMADVRGQQRARRALEIAAAGGHNLLFNGPPGTGKSMLAQRLPGILPAPERHEAIECAAVASILGRSIDIDVLSRRPFRSPHHTASAPALVGGGSEPLPGEISLAHNGVLFLDELPEFNRNVLEVLREPMETGEITISRAGRQASFPARFQLVAAMNPCPCGYLGDPEANCGCSGDRVARYRSKISGPLLDRIDIHVEVQRPPRECLRPDAPPGEDTESIRRRVIAARSGQLERQGCANALLDGKGLHDACRAGAAAWKIVEVAMRRYAMSARANQRVWRVARSIADLAGDAEVDERHVCEALTLRMCERVPGAG